MKTPVRARVVRLRGRTAILKAFSVCFCGEFHSVKAPETRSKYTLQKQGHGMDFHTGAFWRMDVRCFD